MEEQILCYSGRLYQKILKGALFASIVLCAFSDAKPVSIDNPQDYAILDQFFRMGFSSEEYGYVIEGSKPISIRNFPSPDCFPITKDCKHNEIEFNNTLLVREAIPIWNKLCSQNKRFILKAVSLNDGASSLLSTLEVSFINVSKLKEEIEKNIDLFRYVLGPTNTVQSILELIIHKDQPLTEILKFDLTLMGIVLGFGSHNSVVGGRLETILALTISKDHPPFTPQSYIMQTPGEHSLDVLTPERYGTYYLELAGGDDANFRVNLPRLRPESGFANLQEEVQSLDKLLEPLPPLLWEEPRFVFGAFSGGPSNQLFFQSLRKAQKKIRAILERSDFLTYVLGKINGEKSTIQIRQSSSKPVNRIPLRMWDEILQHVAHRFEDKQKQSAFIEALSCPTESFRKPPIIMGASEAALKGLRIAQSKLKQANATFEALDQSKEMVEIVPKRLYFKMDRPGNGKPLQGENLVRVGYTIEDEEGEVLFANCDHWLDLSETIPGFAHGVQGMRVKERRTLFIHPALGYGALTTLPPCSALMIKVHLIDVDSRPSPNHLLPPLSPIDLSWILEDSFYEDLESSLKQQPYFTGCFYHDLRGNLSDLKRSD